jgi:alanine racemase
MPRRAFLSVAAAAGLAPGSIRAEDGVLERRARPSQVPADRHDPWVEVEREVLVHNVEQVSALAGGRPILAVIKNNAYGLDLVTAAGLLEPLPQILGFAVVKTDAAITLRDAGVTKPILHMGLSGDTEGLELVRRGVQPSLFTDDAVERVRAMAKGADQPVDAHAYLDTGMSRMGMPYHRALPWLAELARTPQVRIRGTYMAFTEDVDFDREQLRRFEGLMDEAREAGVDPGALHAASSSGVFELPEAHLDLVRPGIALFGSYPNDAEAQKERATLRTAVRLRARVVRVERLRPGDSVSYGRRYVAQAPTLVATIPAGHVDGVPREAVEGARVLIRNQTYPVIGAVSASHCIVELGPRSPVGVGDVATLMGPDHADIVPDRIATETGTSVYDLYMHLSPRLPRIVV